MKTLNPDKNLSKFFDRLAESTDRVLLLDYDGTLAPFAKERDRAFPYPGVIDCLTGIMENGNTRLVLVSGRSVDDLISLIGLRNLPEIWGSHGGERLFVDGRYQIAPSKKKTSWA
jgi:trehalose 6-phosphate phosphatase